MVDLTADERAALESCLGKGMVEVGQPFAEDDPVVTACRKLGLRPVGWHGEPVGGDSFELRAGG